MEILKTFFINCWKQIYTLYRETLVPLLPFQKVFPLVWVLLIALGVIVVIVLVTSIVSSVKPKKVKFFVNGDLIETIKVKHKTAISFPTNPVIDGSKFLGWATDKEGKNLYESQVLLKNKRSFRQLLRIYEYIYLENS